MRGQANKGSPQGRAAGTKTKRGGGRTRFLPDTIAQDEELCKGQSIKCGGRLVYGTSAAAGALGSSYLLSSGSGAAAGVGVTW